MLKAAVKVEDGSVEVDSVNGKHGSGIIDETSCCRVGRNACCGRRQ